MVSMEQNQTKYILPSGNKKTKIQEEMPLIPYFTNRYFYIIFLVCKIVSSSCDKGTFEVFWRENTLFPIELNTVLCLRLLTLKITRGKIKRLLTKFQGGT